MLLPPYGFDFYLRLPDHHIIHRSGTNQYGVSYQNVPMHSHIALELVQTMREQFPIYIYPSSPYILFTTEEDMAIFKLSLPNSSRNPEEY